MFRFLQNNLEKEEILHKTFPLLLRHFRRRLLLIGGCCRYCCIVAVFLLAIDRLLGDYHGFK